MVDEVIRHAREETPNECCGIVGGKNGTATKLYRMANTVELNQKPFRYEMDGKEVLSLVNELDAKGESFLVIYHSHTATEAYPSPTDVRFAAGWPDCYYLLVSLMKVGETAIRVFRIVEGEITEEDLVLT